MVSELDLALLLPLGAPPYVRKSALLSRELSLIQFMTDLRYLLPRRTRAIYWNLRSGFDKWGISTDPYILLSEVVLTQLYSRILGRLLEDISPSTLDISGFSMYEAPY